MGRPHDAQYRHGQKSALGAMVWMASTAKRVRGSLPEKRSLTVGLSGVLVHCSWLSRRRPPCRARPATVVSILEGIAWSERSWTRERVCERACVRVCACVRYTGNLPTRRHFGTGVRSTPCSTRYIRVKTLSHMFTIVRVVAATLLIRPS